MKKSLLLIIIFVIVGSVCFFLNSNKEEDFLAKQNEDQSALKKAGQTYNKTLKEITGIYIDNFGPIIGLLYLEVFLEQMNYFTIVSRVEISKAVDKIKVQKIATTDI